MFPPEEGFGELPTIINDGQLGGLYAPRAARRQCWKKLGGLCASRAVVPHRLRDEVTL